MISINVTKDNVTITEQNQVHKGEYKVNRLYFTFSEEYENLTCKAIFSTITDNYEVPITNGYCELPSEILEVEQQVILGVYGYELEDEEFVLRYSPTPTTLPIISGSYIKGASGSEEITPTQFEQYTAALNEGLNKLNTAVTNAERLDINASKSGDTTTITITKQDGSQETTEINDGINGQDGQDGQDGASFEYNWNGTSLGVKTSEEQEYEYVNLKGDTGETGPAGQDGADGYTPVKGVDYFTAEDIASLNIPTKTSDLINNNGFIDKNVNDLTYYTLATNTGSSIELSINSSTYVVTLSLKNNVGTILNTQTIDLPLESVVVNGSYDSANKKIILTLQSGSTIEIPVGDLVSGLQSEITSSNKLASDLIDDTNQINKFVSASDISTWNGKYTKPSGGIPSTDLTSAVQTSLGKADSAIQIGDLTNYVTNTDYASDNVGGVIKTTNSYGTEMSSGQLRAKVRNYTNYLSGNDNLFISKGTLENVITGKQLTDKTYVDTLVGDISNAIDLINGESV